MALGIDTFYHISYVTMRQYVVTLHINKFASSRLLFKRERQNSPILLKRLYRQGDGRSWRLVVTLRLLPCKHKHKGGLRQPPEGLSWDRNWWRNSPSFGDENTGAENEAKISLRESPMKRMLGEISDSKPCFPITIHIKTKCAGKYLDR